MRLLLCISMLNGNGYKISAIAKMGPEEIYDTCRDLNKVEDEFAYAINSLVLAMIEFDEERIEKLISESFSKYGFEDSMTKVIYPFFSRVGILWQTGTIRPLQEHFASNIVRQKLISAIDNLESTKDPKAPSYVVFLPQHEYHEIGLLFGGYILRKYNNNVIYLGQNVPESDLDMIYESFEPNYFFTMLTVAPPKDTTVGFLNRIGKKFPKSKILASGAATYGLAAVPDNVIVLSSASELNRYAIHG